MVAHVATQLSRLHLSIDHMRAVIELIVSGIELIRRSFQLIHVLELAPGDAAAATLVQVL